MRFSVTGKEEEEIAGIVALSNETDGTGYSVPADADGWFLSKHDGKTVSFAALFELGETYRGIPVDELSLFTDVSFRKKGRMRKILRKIREEYEGDYAWKVCAFPNGRAASFLLHEGFTHEYDELLMELPLGNGGGAEPLEAEFTRENAHSELSVKVYGNEAYLYGVRTDAAHLREGSAERLLREALSELSEKGISKAVLQVSGQNTPALALYRKLGFLVAEKLEMWYTHKVMQEEFFLRNL